MKKTTLLLLLIFLVIVNTAFIQNHKVHSAQTEGGKFPEEEGVIRNGKSTYLNGNWTIYHDNGKFGTSVYKADGSPLENFWTTYDKNGQSDKLNIPEPTKQQIAALFNDIFDPKPYEGPYKFGYTYQETLWNMAGADPKQYLPSYPIQKWEVIKEIEGYQKVILFWNKYKTKLVAGGFPTSIATGKNILKFSIDMNFTVLITEAVKKYHFDLNFIDPSDGKTVLDFLEDRIEYVKNSPPVDEDKVKEYERLYKMLKTYGVQHAAELK